MAENESVIKTYRYIRLALIALIVLLGLSVGKEILETGRRLGTMCYQTSISAYYYTPAQAIFVSVLVAIGVCMIALKGNSDAEDVLLNLAGMLAPVVAFVPTPDRPVNTICPPSNALPGAVLPGADATVPAAPQSALGFAEENVTNNMGALLWLGVGLLLLVVLLAYFEWRRVDRLAHEPGLPPAEQSARNEALAAANFIKRSFWVGWLIACAVVGFAMFAFFARRAAFLEAAHYGAAIPMFLIIWVVVVLNAVQYQRYLAKLNVGSPTGRKANRYTWIAVGMALAAVVIFLLRSQGEHFLFWIETAQIVGFGAYWVLQTNELWEHGVRPPI